MNISRASFSSRFPCSALALLLFALGSAASPARALPVAPANVPPKAAIVQPSQGQAFVNPAEIQIVVEAADADGYIQSVEVFTDLGSLGVISPDPLSATLVNPLQWTWKNPPAGDHKLVAKATDNGGSSTYSESLVLTVKRDSSPSPAMLTFVKPVDGTVFPTFSDPISIELTAVDPNGDIRHVEFFADGIFIGQSDHLSKEAVIPGRPITHFLEWKPGNGGFYRLTARAIDTQGNPVESAPVTITAGPSLPVVSIVASVPETSEPGPTIRIRPGAFTLKRTGDNGSPLTVVLAYEGSATPELDYKRLPGSVSFPAGAAETELLVQAVEDTTLEPTESVIATIVEPPVDVDRPAGVIIDPQYRTAKVLIHDSTPGHGTALLEITAPKDGEVLSAGQTIVLAATATDPNGYISRVEFYDFDKQIGVSQLYFFRAPDPGTPIQHTFEWQSPPPGEHLLTARAVDSIGDPIVSKPVRIQAGPDNTLPTVQVTAVDAEATELSPLADAVDPARFSITRSGDLTKELYVVYSLHGTAEPDKDYKRPDRIVRIAPGEQEAIVEIVPLSDELAEPMETVVLKLEDPMPISSLPVPPTPYQTTPFTGTATAVIFDRTRPEQGALEFALPSQGDTYAEGQPISIAVAAFHPKFDVSHVDYYAGETLIGSSDMLFSKFAPTSLIVHHFEWKDPIPGDHILTARAVMPDGSILMSGKVQVTVKGSEPSAVVVVDVEGADWEAAESTADGSPDPAVFLIRRIAGPKDVAVSVLYEMSGTAENGIDYAPLDGKAVLGAGEMSVAVQVVPKFDRAVEGEEVAVMTLVPTPCPAIFPVPPWCYQIGPNSAAKAIIHDAPGEYIVPDRVVVVTPQSGSVFTAGEPVTMTAVWRSANLQIATLEIILDDKVVDRANATEITVSLTDLSPGVHVITARAVSSAGVETRSEPVKILVREVDAVAFVERELPAGYAPGESFTVTLRAKPPAGTSAYGLEDQPPADWLVTGASSDGFFDSATGRVKFGLFNDDTPREFTYSVTPPADFRSAQTFKGSSSTNGKLFPIGGDQSVAVSGQAHPADRNPADYAVSLAELTAYGAAWKKGESWDVGPVPIPLEFVTRAGQLWKHGEKYRYDPALGAPPACWTSAAVVALATAAVPTSSYAEREISRPEDLNPSLLVRIKAVPGAADSTYGLQEQLPTGWVASDVSDDGFYDAKANTIRWGVFLDHETRVVSYRATPAPSSAGLPRGIVSFDGSAQEIGGNAKSGVADRGGATPAQFKRIERRPDGTVSLQLGGPIDQLCMLEVSSDLVHWTQLGPVFMPDGEVVFQDQDAGSQTQRFYRTR